jgi:hypothetical protein
MYSVRSTDPAKSLGAAGRRPERPALPAQPPRRRPPRADPSAVCRPLQRRASPSQARSGRSGAAETPRPQSRPGGSSGLPGRLDPRVLPESGVTPVSAPLRLRPPAGAHRPGAPASIRHGSGCAGPDARGKSSSAPHLLSARTIRRWGRRWRRARKHRRRARNRDPDGSRRT